MFDGIKKLFGKRDEEETVLAEEPKKEDILSRHAQGLKGCDPTKDILMVIEDDESLATLLKYDLEEMMYDGKLEEIQVLTYSSINAVYSLEYLLMAYPEVKIKYAVFDLTLGGSLRTDKGTLKYTGVDALRLLKDRLTGYVFFTGNKLNKHIRYNTELIDLHQKMMGKDIAKKIVFKNSSGTADRNAKLLEILKQKIGNNK